MRRMIYSDEARHPLPKDIKPIGDWTVMRWGAPEGSQTLVKVIGVFVDMTHCPLPMETADDVGVLDVVTTGTHNS